MYENYWNLREKPFKNIMDKKFFYYAEAYEEAYLRLLYSISEAQGLFVLLGEAGCGKSLLGKLFMQDMLEQGYQVAFIKNPTSNPSEFLQQILYEFGLGCGGNSTLELRRRLQKFANNLSEGKKSILLVDEAHLLQNPNTFEEIRLILNLESAQGFLITPILIGKPELGDILETTSLRERIGMQYRIPPLSCKETGEYIYYRLDKAGGAREIFTLDAVQEVYLGSGGIPREINLLCDLALLLGYGENAIVIDKMLIKKALAELKGASLQKLKLH